MTEVRRPHKAWCKHQSRACLFIHALGCMTLCYPMDHQCIVVVVESLSCVQLFATPWTAACQASLPFTISWSLLKFMSFVCDGIQPCHPLSPSSFFLQSFPASGSFPVSQLFSLCVYTLFNSESGHVFLLITTAWYN